MLSYLASSLDMGVESIELFALALVRTSTMVFVFPLFAIAGVVPLTARIGFAFFLAIVVFPQLPAAGFVIQNSPIFFFTLVIEQVLIGLILGFAATFLFHFVVMAGHYMARDIGISMGGSMDPIQDETADDVTILILLIFSIVFLASGYHHHFVQIMVESFQYIPIGHWNYDFSAVVKVLMVLTAQTFVLSIKMAAPVMVAMIVTAIGMAMTARVMPAMNIWILAVPIKVFFGIFILWESFPLLLHVFNENFDVVLQGLMVLLEQGSRHG